MKEQSGSETARQFSSNSGRSKLWQQSEITTPFVSPLLSFQRERRFKWASIYWPQYLNIAQNVKDNHKSEVDAAAIKISKLIDEEEKNELRFKQVKRSFSIAHSLTASIKRQTHSVLSTRKPFKLGKQTEQIVKKLAAADSKKQSKLRDRYGNRCNLFEDPQNQEVEVDVEGPKSLGMSTGFNTGLKMRLELPHNFYPGPGAYEIKRYLSEREGPNPQKRSFKG